MADEQSLFREIRATRIEAAALVRVAWVIHIASGGSNVIAVVGKIGAFLATRT